MHHSVITLELSHGCDHGKVFLQGDHRVTHTVKMISNHSRDQSVITCFFLRDAV